MGHFVAAPDSYLFPSEGDPVLLTVIKNSSQ